MKTYSVLLMRRERIPTLFPIVLCGGICLIFAAYFGALWMVGKEISLLLFGVCLLLFLFCMGLYLFATDEKRLLRKTKYGRMLIHRGMKTNASSLWTDAEKTARTLMDEIDREAKNMLFECGCFALTENWIILYERPRVSAFLKGALFAYPISRQAIQRIRWEAVGKEKNNGFRVSLWVEDTTDPHMILTYDQATIQALRAWGAAIQEKRDL